MARETAQKKTFERLLENLALLLGKTVDEIRNCKVRYEGLRIFADDDEFSVSVQTNARRYVLQVDAKGRGKRFNLAGTHLKKQKNLTAKEIRAGWGKRAPAVGDVMRYMLPKD